MLKRMAALAVPMLALIFTAAKFDAELVVRCVVYAGILTVAVVFIWERIDPASPPSKADRIMYQELLNDPVTANGAFVPAKKQRLAFKRLLRAKLLIREPGGRYRISPS